MQEKKRKDKRIENKTRQDMIRQEKRSLLLPKIETRFLDPPAHNLVTTLPEPWRLHKYYAHYAILLRLKG